METYRDSHSDTAPAMMSAEPARAHREDPTIGGNASPDEVTWIGRDREARAPVRPARNTLDGLRARKRPLLIAGALVAVLAVAVGVHLASKPPALVPLANQHSVPLVSVIVPGLHPVSTQVMVTGAIQARHDLPIGDAGQTGRIVAVYAQVGDHVRKGELLAKIDDSVLLPQVAQLEASLTKARAQAQLSAAEYRRALAIGPQGGLSVQNIEQNQANAQVDAANVRMVAAELAQARAQLALTRVVAPVAGIVLTRNAEVGQIASNGGAPLFTLEDQSQVELDGQVAEQDLASLKVGQDASVYLVGYAKPFHGHIWLLGATVDPQTRLGQVRIALDPNPALRPGSFAHAVIYVSHAQRPVVPQTAILSDSNGTYIYVVGSDGRVERRNVQIGNVIAAGVVIESGLTGGERVVSLAGGFLQSGETVKATDRESRS